MTVVEDPSDSLTPDLSVPPFLARDGAVASLLRDVAWQKSWLGPATGWPLELKTLVGMMMAAVQPMFIAWGAERMLLYNDAYTRLIGSKHPAALGQPMCRVFAEAWTDLEALFQKVFAGQSIHVDDFTLMLDRAGAPEEAHFSFSYTPVRDETGQVVALFCAATETTSQVLSQRRLSEQRERQRQLLQQMPGFVALLHGPDHVYEYVNDAYIKVAGARDFIGRSVREVFPELEGQGFYELLDRVYTTGVAFKSPAAAIRLTGECEDRFLDLLYEPIKADDGSVSGVFVGGHDVTDVHRTSHSLRDSEGYIRLLLASTSEGFYAVDCEGRTTLCNAAFLNMLGFESESQVVGRKLHDVIHHTHPDGSIYHASLCPLYLCASAGRPAHVRDEFFYHVDGRKLPVEYWAHPIFQDGELRGAICNFRDVTEQRQNEEALRELNDALEHRVETRTMERDRAWKNSQDLQAVVGADGFLRAVNRAWTTILGWEPEELIGRHHLDISHPDEVVASRKVLAIAAQEEIPTYETRCRHKDGSYRWIAWVAAPDEGLIYASGRHITAEKEIASALATMQARTQTMFETSFQMQGLCALDGTLLSANTTSLLAIGATIDQVVGMPYWDTLWFATTPGAPALVRAGIEAGAAGHASRQEISLNVPSGRRTYDFSIRPIRDGQGSVIGVVPEAMDITERRMAEESLRQSRKLEAMGQLTGGIAHDFNNLLTPIMLSLDMLRDQGVGSERDQRRIAQALEATNRARTLVQRLLAFARRQPLMPTAVDLRRLVDGMVSLLVSTLGPSIGVSVEMPDDLPAAHVDANQLEMAILNLGVNARDAMPHGGTLTLAASTAWVDVGHRSALSPGSFIRLCVSDTGTGMDDETLKRAIEPFFSTKAVGQGTGLGLSMVHGLASQLGGALTIASRLNIGTDIELWLPVSEMPVAAEKPEREVTRAAKAAGLALLVDDDELVRAVTADMLGEMGYQVVEASSAEAALQILEQGLAIDALITDHLMPGMNGTDLARKVIASHPKARVLVVSGYADTAAFAPDIPHLTKPFRVDDLSVLLNHGKRQS